MRAANRAQGTWQDRAAAHVELAPVSTGLGRVNMKVNAGKPGFGRCFPNRLLGTLLKGTACALCVFIGAGRASGTPLPTSVQLQPLSIDDGANVSGIPGGNLNWKADPG